MADTKAGGVKNIMGFENTRLASQPQAGHAIVCGDVPSGRVTSNEPWSAH
jgi:hypothetical protein